MNSDVTPRAKETLARLLAELDEAHIGRLIDSPVDRTFRAFTACWVRGPNGKTPEQVFSQFVQYVYGEGLHTPWRVINRDATSMMLLEDHYRGLRCDGYHAAIQDADDPNTGGVPFVLAQLAEIIRTKERQAYMDAVFIRHIDPLDWPLQLGLVEVLLDHFHDLLPSELLDCAPWQLVDEIPALTLAIIAGVSTVEAIGVAPQKTPTN